MVDEFTQFGGRTGHVDLIDFDRGVLLQTGAQYDRAQNEWFLPLSFYVEIPGQAPVAIERALVVYKRPEPTQVQHNVPQIVLIRDDIAPATSRLQSPTVQYRIPAEGATPVSIGGEIGYTQYETKDQERPYDLTYSIEVWARYLTTATFLLQMMMRRFPIRGTLAVIGSEEPGRGVTNKRTYLFEQEGFVNLTEVNSMVERIPGFGLTIRVEAELTLDREPFTVPAFTGPLTLTPPPGMPFPPLGFPENGNDPGDGINPDGTNPDLPAGGLYGTGQPSIRATPLED